MDQENPANLRAKINHYRQMMRLLDDPAVCESLEAVIRLAEQRIADFAVSATPKPSSVSATEGAHTRPARLGDVLYAKPTALVSEQDWASLVEAVAAGDQLALHALFERAHLSVLVFAERILDNRESAEEVTVDVFHDVWRQAAIFDPARNTVLAWIMNQARSRAMNCLRDDPPSPYRLAAGRKELPSGSLQTLLANRIAEEIGKEPVPVPTQQWSEPEWVQVAPGIECKLLAADTERHRVSMLVRLAPGASYPAHTHAGTEELFLLDGELWIDERKLFPGDYNYGAAGTDDNRVWSETGCRCVLVTSIQDRLH